MTHPRYLACLFFTALLAAAPVQADSDTESEQPNRSMEEQWNETMENLKSYSAEQRDQALKAGRKTLDAMDRRLDEMEAWTKEKWSSLSEDTREERTEMLRYMREQRSKVAEWYGGMKHSSSDAWESTKRGFIGAYEELQESYDDAVDSFRSGDEAPPPESSEEDEATSD